MNYLFLNVFWTVSSLQLIAGHTITPAINNSSKINETLVGCDCSFLNVTLCESCTAICGRQVGGINFDENKKFITIGSVALLIAVTICGTIYLAFYFKRKKFVNGKAENQEQSKPIEELKIHEIKSDGNTTVTNETNNNGKDQTSHSQSIVQDDQLDEISLSD